MQYKKIKGIRHRKKVSSSEKVCTDCGGDGYLEPTFMKRFFGQMDEYPCPRCKGSGQMKVKDIDWIPDPE